MKMSRNKPVMAAFDRGQIPTIACVNRATVPLRVSFPALIHALQKFVDTCFSPVWGTPAKMTAATRFIPGAWAIVFLDTADAVEEEEFLIDGIAMSDFVYPSFFEGFRKPNSTQFDYLKKVKRPFQILKGGYMPVFRDGKWTQVFGSASKQRRFQQEDRRGHRTGYRNRPPTERSRPF